jgi:hypothetical protein
MSKMQQAPGLGTPQLPLVTLGSQSMNSIPSIDYVFEVFGHGSQQKSLT